MSSFDEILSECLNDIEAGQATIEECLRRYPEQAEALRPLLQTAAALRALPPIEPSAAFQAAAPTRLANLIASRRQPSARLGAALVFGQMRRRWASLVLRVAAVVVLASCLLAGTAYAARESLPDSPLYPVKLTVERVQVATTPNDARRARVFVGVMDQRTHETAVMLRNSNLKQARQTNQSYVRTLSEAAAIVEHVPANRPENRMLLLYMRDRLLAQQATYQRALSSAPEQVRPLIQSTLGQIQKTLDRINSQLAADKSLLVPSAVPYGVIS